MEEENVKGMPSVWRSTRARVVALGVVIALAPLPVAAAETSRSARPAIDFNAAVVKIVATGRLAPTSASRVQTPNSPAGDASLESSSFFRTPLGIAVIAIVGAGTGYALYSAKHDRIHSTTR
jgi:hypothetical protein